MITEVDLDEQEYRAENGWPLPAPLAVLLIAELRVSRKVVEAARGLTRLTWFMDSLDSLPLTAALAELSSINAKGSGE